MGGELVKLSDAPNTDKMISDQYMLATPDTFDPAVHSYNYQGGLPQLQLQQIKSPSSDSHTTIPVFLSAQRAHTDNALYFIRQAALATTRQARVDHSMSEIEMLLTPHQLSYMPQIAGLVTVTSCELSLSGLLLRSVDADQSEASPKNVSILIDGHRQPPGHQFTTCQYTVQDMQNAPSRGQ